MTPKTAFLNDRLTYRLNVLAHKAIALNDGIFVRETGNNIRELRVLRLIDDNSGITFVDIVAATGLERSLVSRILQRLIAQGFLRRENSQTDARKFRLVVTDAGKAQRALARKVSDRLERLLTQPFGSEELDRFNASLDRLSLWIGSPDYEALLSKELGAISQGDG